MATSMINYSYNAQSTLSLINGVPTEVLETGPIFINFLDRVIFTFFAFIALLLILSMNGFFVGLVFYYRRLHTPYFAILVNHSFIDVIISATVFSSVIYISLSGYNPFLGDRVKCFVHRIFSITPFLSKVHSICILSVDRLLFFYKPLWYIRVVSIRLVIAIEMVILTVALIFNIAATAVGDIYFSPTTMVCSNSSKPWVWITQMTLYVIPSLTSVAFTIVSLHHLILKQRRTVADQHRSTSGATSAVNRENIHVDNTGFSRSDNSTGRTSLSNAEVADLQRNVSENHNCTITKIKAATKLVGMISGLFWITYIPALIGFNVLLAANKLWEADLGINIKYRIIMRILSFLITLSWLIDPFIYLLVNPQLRQICRNLLQK